MQEYTENHPLLVNTPLNPRDAFFGGRTGNTKLYYKAREGEKLNITMFVRYIHGFVKTQSTL